MYRAYTYYMKATKSNERGLTSKRTRTSFSESPLHLLTSVEAIVKHAQHYSETALNVKQKIPEILKNVVLHSVATAFASIVLLR
jgi:hypothetical protein